MATESTPGRAAAAKAKAQRLKKEEPDSPTRGSGAGATIDRERKEQAAAQAAADKEGIFELEDTAFKASKDWPDPVNIEDGMVNVEGGMSTNKYWEDLIYGDPDGDPDGGGAINAGKLLALGSFLVSSLFGGKHAIEGVDAAQIDMRALASDLFGIQSDMLDKILEAEGGERKLRESFEKLRQDLVADNFGSGLDTWGKLQPQIDKIIQVSRGTELEGRLDEMKRLGGAFEDAAASTVPGQIFNEHLGNLRAANQQAMQDLSRTFGQPQVPVASADPYMPAFGSPTDEVIDIEEEPYIDPQVARFLEGEGEVAKLHQAMSDNPNWGIAQGTEGYQLGQEFGGGIITGFTPEGAPIQSGNATPETLNALRDYVAGEGPIAEYLAQQEIDEAGQTYGDPGVAGTAPNRPWNRTQDPQFFAQQGGGGGGFRGGGGGGGSPYFGASPFGNLGGRILPGLESAAMTQPFRPLLASLNQQALYPGVSPITQSLFQDALQELPLGGALTPGQQRDIEQQSLELAERQGNLRSRATDFAVLFNTDQAKQVRERERQNYAASVNEMAQQEQERNRQFGINVEGATQSALGQDREFGLGVGNLLGGLNLQGQELAQRGGIASAELGQMAQRIEQDRINQARNFLLNSASPFAQAAQAVDPSQLLAMQGTTGVNVGFPYQQMIMGQQPAGPALFPTYDMSPLAQRMYEADTAARMESYRARGDYYSGLGSGAGRLFAAQGGGGGGGGGGDGAGNVIGGAVGGFFGPIGTAIGSAIGGGIGNLFKKKR